MKHSGMTKQDFIKFYQPLIEKLMDYLPEIIEDAAKGKPFGVEYCIDGTLAFRIGDRVLRTPSNKVLPNGKEITENYLKSIRKSILKTKDFA